MGKWTYETEGWKGRHIKVNGLGWASIDDMYRAHNADCDAYEARIAELEAKQFITREHLGRLGITPDACMLREAEASARLANQTPPETTS